MTALLSSTAPHPGRPILVILMISLIAIEYLAGRLAGANHYDPAETLVTVAIAIACRLTNALTAGILAIPGLWIYQHRLFDLSLLSGWSLLLLFLGVEFCYYWHHRAMHRVNWLWATHAVHHSPTRLNLSAALRLGVGGNLTGGFLFYLPLVLLGFSPLAVAATIAAGLVYQFFLHAERAPCFGVFERLLNTPTHHHIHHALNETCLDKNFGNVLIIFDRLFGTFGAAPENEPLRYGLKGKEPLMSRSFAVVATGWLDLSSALRRAVSWRGRWEALFGPPL